LAPEIADLFEREANNFARFSLFQGNGFAHAAADCKFEIKTPIKLAKRFGASVYASILISAMTAIVENAGLRAGLSGGNATPRKPRTSAAGRSG
jgi:hypothetical protein